MNIFNKLVALILICVCSTGFAKTLNLYDQAATNAKVIGAIDSDNGIIPIFMLKGGEWIKVGDPKNGNTGWLKQSDLNTVAGLTLTQQVIYSGNSPHTFQIIQYGSPQKMTPEQANAMLKQIQVRQQAVQQSMEQMMKSMQQPFQIMMPVLIVPAQPIAKPAKSGG